MIATTTIQIPADHPALTGHFPGNPIVPGAVILDLAGAFVAERMGGRITRVLKARFTAPLAPNTPLVIEMEPKDGELVAVTCRSAEATVMTAIMEWGPDLADGGPAGPARPAEA